VRGSEKIIISQEFIIYCIYIVPQGGEDDPSGISHVETYHLQLVTHINIIQLELC
jgi:hypothetical protein